MDEERAVSEEELEEEFITEDPEDDGLGVGVAVALDPPGVVGLGVTVALGLLVGVALPEDGLVVGVAVAGLVVGVG